MQTFDAPASNTPSPQSGPSLSFVLISACLLVPLLNGIPGAYMTSRGYSSLLVESATYDEHFDPIVVKNGEVSAGERLVYHTDGAQTMLIDPDERIPDSQVTTPRSFVVRRTTITRTEPLRTQTYQVSAFQEAVGLGDFTIDSQHLSDALNAYRWHFYLLGVLFYLANSVVDLAFIGIYGCIPALILPMVLRGRGLSFASVLRPAIVVGVATVPLAWLLWAIGLPVGLVGFMVWPPLIFVATTVWVMLTSTRQA